MNSEVDGCPLTDHRFGQTVLSMIVLYIVFLKVICKFMELLLHLKLTFITVLMLNELLTEAVSDK